MPKFDDVERCAGLVINAPEVFRRPDFIAWLNAPATTAASWHRKGDGMPGEYADTIVLVNSAYEGSDPEMPDDIWRAVCDAVYAEFNPGRSTLPDGMKAPVVVRLTNLA